MKLKNKRVLVTGATGFIGANLTRRLLKEGSRVNIFTRDESDKWRIKDVLKDVSSHTVDILNEQKLNGAINHIKPEIILHAAVYGGYRFQKDTKKIFDTNFISTVNLLSACKKVGFEVFINTGSSSEYGVKRQAMKEDDLLEPVSNYGVSKAFATLYCQSYAKREKIPVVTLRLFSPYGYFDDPSRMIADMIMTCLSGKEPKVLSPLAVRDFIFIEDVMDSYIKTIEHKDSVGGEIFNIGYGKQHSVKKVVNTITRLTGNRVKLEYADTPASTMEPKTWQADISKAEKKLKWEPRFGLSDGLKKTIEWFEDNSALYKGRPG